MRGSPLIERRVARWHSISKSHTAQMVMMTLAVGVMAGILAANIRLHLGLSGHKALIWMTPVLMARLLGRFKAGTSVGVLAAALTSMALGGNLAGGLAGLPLVGVVGVFLDSMINFLEKHKYPILLTILTLPLTGMAANLIMCGKRLLSPRGLTPDKFMGFSGVWFEVISYATFGFLAGLIAMGGFYLGKKRRQKSS